MNAMRIAFIPITVSWRSYNNLLHRLFTVVMILNTNI